MIKERIFRLKPLLIAAAVTSIAVAYVFFFSPESTVAINPPNNPAAVNITHTSAQERTPFFHSFGVVKAHENSEINAATSSEVSKLFIQVGQSVEKNQPLLELDSRYQQSKVHELSATLEQLKAKGNDIEQLILTQTQLIEQTQTQLQLTQDQKDRMEKLYKSQMSSQTDLDNSKNNLSAKTMEHLHQKQQLTSLQQQQIEHRFKIKQVQEQLQQAQLELDHTIISAPFSGQVTTLHASLGKEVSPGSRLLSLLNPRSFYLEVQIPLRHYAALSQYNGTISAYQNQHRFTLKNLQQTSNQTISTPGIFEPEDTAASLVEGHTVSVDVSLPPIRNLFSLPEECFYEQNTIYQVVNNTLQPILVKRIGWERTDANQSSVLFTASDLKDHADILMTRLPYPYAGQPVHIRDSSV